MIDSRLNDTFHFSMNIRKFKFYLMNYFSCHLFFACVQISVQTQTLTFLLEHLATFLKKKNVIRYSSTKTWIPNRILTNFIHLKSKMASEMNENIKSCDLKTTQIQIKTPISFQKAHITFIIMNIASQRDSRNWRFYI